jgi:hypothetical protein
VSYCRFGDSDAYIFEHVGGFWQCCACWLEVEDGDDGEEFWKSADFATKEELLEHIDKHRKAGHYIPEDVDERLRDEMENERHDNSTEGKEAD